MTLILNFPKKNVRKKMYTYRRYYKFNIIQVRLYDNKSSMLGPTYSSGEVKI